MCFRVSIYWILLLHFVISQYPRTAQIWRFNHVRLHQIRCFSFFNRIQFIWFLFPSVQKLTSTGYLGHFWIVFFFSCLLCICSIRKIVSFQQFVIVYVDVKTLRRYLSDSWIMIITKCLTLFFFVNKAISRKI